MIEEIKSIISDFKLSEKYTVWENDQQESDYDDYDDCLGRESYGQYAGS